MTTEKINDYDLNSSKHSSKVSAFKFFINVVLTEVSINEKISLRTANKAISDETQCRLVSLHLTPIG
jgi:hypothetical protein